MKMNLVSQDVDVERFLAAIRMFIKTIVLNEPASEKEITAYEKELGITLPSPLVRLWALHDGQKLTATDQCLFDYFPFYSIKRSRKERKDLRTLAIELGTENESDDFVAWAKSARAKIITVRGPVKARAYNKLWIPLGSFGGTVFRFIDMDPAPGGHLGQVIEHSLEGLSWRVLAPSFTSFLKQITSAVKRSKGIWSDHEVFPDDECDLPAYLLKVTSRHKKPAAKNCSDSSNCFLIHAQIRSIIGYAGGEMVLKLSSAEPKKELFALVQKKTKGRARVVMGAKGNFTLLTRAEVPNGGVTSIPYLVESFD